MRLPHLLLSIIPTLLGTGTVFAAEAGSAENPAPPGVAFLYNANITVGLTVDVGAIPAGNVSVIPVIGGALVGPKFSGNIFFSLYLALSFFTFLTLTYLTYLHVPSLNPRQVPPLSSHLIPIPNIQAVTYPE